MSRTLKLLLVALLLAPAALVLDATPAGAWAWNPNVTLQGTSHCGSSPTTWVWVQASNGERGWATNGRGRYRFSFKRVPFGGTTVKVNYGNGTFRCTDSFGLKRPATGTSATRNVFKLVPNG